MTDKIKLKVEKAVTQDFVTVDAQTKEKTTDKRAVEFISQGNHVADLTVGNVVETDSREFADYLVHTLGLKEISAPPAPPAPPAFQFGDEYPADFPHRKVFIGKEIRHETAIGLDREQLIAIIGIGPKYADQVLAFVNPDGDSTEIVEMQITDNAVITGYTAADENSDNGGEV